MIEKVFLSARIKELNNVIKNRNATITEINAYTVVLNDKIKKLEDTVEFRDNIIRHVKECNKILEKEIKKEEPKVYFFDGKELVLSDDIAKSLINMECNKTLKEDGFIFDNLEEAKKSAMNCLTKESAEAFDKLLKSYDKLKQEEKGNA